MRTQLATYALAGALGVSGVAGAALVAPAVSYAATGDSTALDARVTSATQALAVGRIDMVAAAEALGITEPELRTQTRAGQSLADIAEAEGVAESELVDALVVAAQTRLAEAVTAGRLTQAEADARATDLEARITDSLDERCGPGGRGGHGPAEDDAAEDSATPSTAPSAAPSSDA